MHRILPKLCKPVPSKSMNFSNLNNQNIKKNILKEKKITFELTSLVILMNCMAASANIPLLFNVSVLNSVARVANWGALQNEKCPNVLCFSPRYRYDKLFHFYY